LLTCFAFQKTPLLKDKISLVRLVVSFEANSDQCARELEQKYLEQLNLLGAHSRIWMKKIIINPLIAPQAVAKKIRLVLNIYLPQQDCKAC
jgi:hypothetical protein